MRLRAACLMTHNIRAMAAFYAALFGREAEVVDVVDYRFASEQLTLFRLEDADETPSTTHASLIYTVDDPDAVHARLAAQGIDAPPPTDKPWGVRSFLVTDPDGNLVSFTKPLA